MSHGRVADYDRIADKYDRRYDLHAYAGVSGAQPRAATAPRSPVP